MFDNARVLNIVAVMFALIGLITVLSIARMTVMHFNMMHGMRFCSQAMHFGQ